MATTNFYLSKRNRTGGEAEVFARFSYKRGCTFRLRTGMRVPIDAWNEAQGKLIIPRIPSQRQTALKALQASMSSLSSALSAISVKCGEKANKAFWQAKVWELLGTTAPANDGQDKGEVKQAQEASQQKPQSKSVDMLFEEFLKLRYKGDARRQMDVARRVLLRFAKYKKREIALSDWNGKLLAELEEFLRIEHTFFDSDGNCKRRWAHIYKDMPERRANRERGKNAIFAIMKKIRTFFNYCVTVGKITKSPFVEHKLTECVYGTPFYMTVDELNVLYNHDFGEKTPLAVQRDIFVLQSNLGMRIGDFYALTVDNVVNGAIEYIPSKTIHEVGKVIRVPLTERAQGIIKRYHSNGSNGLMPFISQQKYNAYIKEMLRLAGINRIVTILNPTTRLEEQHPIWEVASSHMARRNFIGNIYESIKDPNIISSMTGHRYGSKAFERYRAIQDDVKIDALKAFNN